MAGLGRHGCLIGLLRDDPEKSVSFEVTLTGLQLAGMSLSAGACRVNVLHALQGRPAIIKGSCGCSRTLLAGICDQSGITQGLRDQSRPAHDTVGACLCACNALQ